MKADKMRQSRGEKQGKKFDDEGKQKRNVGDEKLEHTKKKRPRRDPAEPQGRRFGWCCASRKMYLTVLTT